MKSKFILSFFVIIYFMLSCSTNQNNNTTTVVPAAPSNLTATVISTTQVNLTWTDNATNESGYKIQRKTPGGNFSDVASTGADITTFSDLGLIPNTTYTYRVYAYNSAGNSLQYSNEVTVTTSANPGNQTSVTIGTQIWSTKNLDVAKYRNGDPIPQVTDPTTWGNLTTGAWCWYNNDSATYAATYGRLYNWYAVNDPRGLAPQGWHVPTDAEWNRLVKFIDPGADTVCWNCSQSETAGGALKSTTGWASPNFGATNSSGFTALPGGYRNEDGSFNIVGYHVCWWSASEKDPTYAWTRMLNFSHSSLERDRYIKTDGFSVRLVKD